VREKQNHFSTSNQPPWKTTLKRLGGILCVVGVYGLYYPIGMSTYGKETYILTLPIDKWIPLSLIWLYPYSFIYLCVFTPVCVIKSEKVFMRTLAAALLVLLSGFTVFLLFPTELVLRPKDFPTDTFLYWGLRFTHWVDPPFNCFPSMHVTMGSLTALACWKADKVIGSAMLVMAGLISLSTMFIKQHYFLDVVLGLLLAYVAYQWLIHPIPTDDIPENELRYPRLYPICLFLFGIAMIIGMYIAFRYGWKPWESHT